jgi:23S rRNA pseudouridine1911/1915/1917 synthase
MDEELTFEGTEPTRLDLFLKQTFPVYSRSYLEKVIEKGFVEVNGQKRKKSFILELLDTIHIVFPPLEPLDLSPVAMDIPVLYEDEHLLVIHKNAHLVCHPAPGTYEPTLVQGLLHKFQQLSPKDPIRPGIVHRLDKETSGVMIVAKTLQAHEAMTNQFKNRQVKKTYLAVVHKTLKNCTVNSPIGRSLKDRKKMAIDGLHAKEAITDFSVMSSNQYRSLVCAFPHTGRTHQIRVHLASIHHPIVGDKVYGFCDLDKKNKSPRTLLHAWKIQFYHPISGNLLEFVSDPPQDFLDFIRNDSLDLSSV